MATNFRVGDRVRVKLNSCYRHYFDGLEGRVACVLFHGVVVKLDNPPGTIQRVIEPPYPNTTGRSSVGPKVPVPQQHVFQFHELEKLD